MNGDETVKLHKLRLTGEKAAGAAGTCLMENNRLYVNDADELLEIAELQFAGARRMEAAAALRGRSLKALR